MTKTRFNYIIIDDSADDTSALQCHLDKFEELKLLATFGDPQAGRSFLMKNDVDFLFLDIDMPGLNGIELLRLIPDPPVTVICTAHAEFMAQGFELEVVDYLLKPIAFDRLVKTVRRAKRRLGQASESDPEIYHDYININIGNGIRKFIRTDTINYVRAANHQCRLSVVDPKTGGESIILARQSFGSVVDYLSKKHFFPVDRSGVVALDRIKELRSSGHVLLSIPNDKMVSITKANLAKLRKLTGSD